MHRCLGCMREYKDEYQVCPYCGYEVGTPPKEAYHMVPGTLLAGRYTVGQVLGFGGFGVTYIGYDNVLERKVAIKEYLPSEFSTRIPGQTEVTTYAGERTEQFNSGLTKFLDEAKTLAKLQSANGVVQIYNSFQENNTAYIVMEYLEGKTLKTYLEETEKIPVEEAKEILHPIITALKEVHALGIIHRDIAPDNIFLTNDGRVKLLDFGASRFATTSHSKSLSVIIKQGYAPVEQYRSRGDQGPWTDVYSLSATLYKMITGITPEDAMERIEKEELKKPSKLGIDIPKNTENAIMNALNIKIEDRTHDIEAFEKELYHDENVKLKIVHLKKADVGKWPLWAKLTVSGASVAVATFAVLLITGVISFSRIEIPEFLIPDGKTRVPNVVNEEVDYAQTTLKDAELYFQIVDKQYSEYIPQDMVLTQSINRGKIVDVNGVVEVVVSGGLEHIFMVDVYGYNKDEAIKILKIIDYDGADHPRYEGDWYLERTDYATKNENYSVWKTAYTPYRYTFTFSNLSAWSNPVETLPGTYYDKKDVTMYSSRTRNRHYIYSFYRWVDEVTFSADKQTENSNCKLIAQRTLYRYRDKKDVYTYYFYQWGDWSGWRDEKIEKSDSREVQARTMYRYKLKQ